MRTRMFGILTLAVLLFGMPLTAHHGAASFDDKEITLKGTVTEWLWQNPHCFLKFDAMDSMGTTRTWVVETSNPPDMASRGWARSSFKVGDQVTVTIQPVKSGAPVGRMRYVILPNGTKLDQLMALPPAAGTPAPKPAL